MANPLEGNPLDATKEEEIDPHFDPVIKLTEQVDTKTHEEDENILFKMRAKLFRFESTTSEWKERGTGDARLLEQKTTKKVRLVMRRDKTLKVCANHHITADMNLQPNIGSDRSWVWRVAADFAEGEPTAETLAIRFANSDHAKSFKEAFDAAKAQNASLTSSSAATGEDDETAEGGQSKSEDPHAAEEGAPDVNPAPGEHDAAGEGDDAGWVHHEEE